MIYLILVNILGLGQPEAKTDFISHDEVVNSTHDKKTVSHSNSIKYIKAPTPWVKVINN